MSLWTMLMLCRYFSAPARLYTMTEASLSVYLAEEVMASNRSPPCTKVKARHCDNSQKQIRCISTPLVSIKATLTSSITR